MDTDTIAPAPEAGLDALPPGEPYPLANLREMREAKEWAAYRAAVVFEDLPADASRSVFVGALRAAFPALAHRSAEAIVDREIATQARKKRGQFGPHPTNIFALVATPPSAEEARLRKVALNMYLEKRASRPKHDPIPAPAAPTKSDAWAEADARVEARRAAMGLPSGLLRTVDYDPAQEHGPPTWLVKGLLPDRGMGLLVGESQSGKSFLAIHAAVCVARGAPLFGRKTKPGAVLYIAAEGGSGVLPRIRAADEAVGATSPLLRKANGASAHAPIKVVVQTPNLSRDGDTAAVERTIRAAHRAFKQEDFALSLVIVDTWHASLGGADEQAAADAGHALKPFREAMEELGVFTLIVHHPGKDLERGARGTSALRAAVDTEIELRVPGFDGSKAKPAGVVRRGQLTKQRDGAVGEEFHYRLNVVEIGRDADGDPWTTCTVLPCDAPAAETALKGKSDCRLTKAIEAALAECGGERAELRMVRGYFNHAGPAAEKDETRRKAFRRALDKACDAGTIEMDSCDQFIWFSESARDTGQRDTP